MRLLGLACLFFFGAVSLGMADDILTPPKVVRLQGAEVIFKEAGQVILEVGGQRYLIDSKAQNVTPLGLGELAPRSPEASPTPHPSSLAPVQSPLFASVTFDRFLINLPTDRFPPRGAFELHFTHRFTQSVSGAELSEVFGLDGFAFPAVGASYAPRSDLLFSLYRTPFEKTFEVETKFRVLEEKAEMPLGLAVRGGLEFNTSRQFRDGLQASLQLILSTTWFDRLTLYVVPSWATRTNPFPGSSGAGTTAIGVGGTIKLTDVWAAVGEWIPALGGFRERHQGFAAGLQRRTWGHVFTFLVQNSAGGTTTRQYLRGGDDQVRLGFNITRRFYRYF